MAIDSDHDDAGSAGRWGPLWGARPEDWAVSEEQQRPTYEAALARVAARARPARTRRRLRVGRFLELVAVRGARAGRPRRFGGADRDARDALPSADLRVGEMESLPFADDSVRSRHRVQLVLLRRRHGGGAARGGPGREARRGVVIQVWGAHERCSLEAMKEIARPYFPPRPPDAPPDPISRSRAMLEALATDAGLDPRGAFATSWAYTFPDAETLGRVMLAPAGLALAVGPEREEEVVAAIVDGLAPYRLADGSYRLENEYRYLVARA